MELETKAIGTISLLDTLEPVMLQSIYGMWAELGEGVWTIDFWPNYVVSLKLDILLVLVSTDDSLLLKQILETFLNKVC
jgi:hypothetical protein